MLEDSDSGSDIEILDETNSSVVQPNIVSNDLVDDIHEFNLPPGIILKPKGSHWMTKMTAFVCLMR